MTVGLKLEGHQDHVEGFLKRGLDANCRVSDSAHLGWDLRMGTSNKFPGDVDTGPGTPLWGAGSSERDIAP